VPPGRDPNEKLPLIIAFDPHGDGNLAVRSLTGAVTEFDCIVAGSNVIRNGYEKMEDAFATMTGDIFNLFQADRQRIYAVGFSGGGRFAQIFSQMYTDTRAVISIGAGSVFNPSAQPVNKLPILFIAGNEDFNYMEINNSVDNLKAGGFLCYFFEYDGKHEWPERKIMDEALLWFEFDNFRRNKNRTNASLIKDFRGKIIHQAQQLVSDHDMIHACREYEKGIAFLSGLADTKSMSKKIESLEKTEEYKAQLNRKQHASSLEIRLQQGYIRALGEKDTTWWKNEISNVDREIQAEDDIFLLPAYRRVRNFLSMAAYSLCNTAMRENDPGKTARLIEIYRIIDPGNPDVFYFSALYYSRSGNPGLAKEYFRKAVSLGFNDLKKAAGELPAEIYKSGFSQE
jgi:predicted esterase